MPLLFRDVGGGLVGVVLNDEEGQAGREEAGAGEGEDELSHQLHIAPRGRIKKARPPILVSIKQPAHLKTILMPSPRTPVHHVFGIYTSSKWRDQN